jgi:hypothetical protein
MNTLTEPAAIARRILGAMGSQRLKSIEYDLQRAKPFPVQDEERFELLGAIIEDLQAPPTSIGPHLQLLRHLARGRGWAY